MKVQIYVLALLALMLNGCGALSEQVGTDIAPGIGTDVAVQVGTQVVDLLDDSPTSSPVSTAPPTDSYDCARKTCGNMTKCAEAVYKLNTCEHASLDSDGDGIPCESICSAMQVTAVAVQEPPTPQPAASGSAGDGSEIAQVTRVIDGDTIDVLLNGEKVRIRYLQINTPERDEPCFRESTQANADLVSGKTVRLVPDKELVDPFDRLLRYIYVGDVLVNRVLVEQGFAEVALYPPNDKHYDEFVQLEAEAAAAGRGCHPTGIFDDGSTTR